MMNTLFGQRYGTHGTTYVISFLSRFSQQFVRSSASLALQAAMSASTLGTLLRLPLAPTVFAIAGVMPTSE